MEDATTDLHGLITSSRRVAQRLLTIGENRLVLLAIEMQEERERLLHLVFMALAMAVLALLAGIAGTALIVVTIWPYAPLTCLGGLASIYALSAWALWRRIRGMMQDWNAFPATMDQMHKDKRLLDEALA